MKAVVIDQYGPAGAVQIRDIEKPVPGDRQILVRVKSASINPIDWKVRRGDLRLIVVKKFPRVLGVDFAGDIEAVGAQVKGGFKPGDRVFGMCNPVRSQFGSYAEYTLVEPEVIAHRPDTITEDQAASLPVAGLAALKGLRQLIGQRHQMRVLINGASGGVGTFAVQIAKADGAYVVATCGKNNIDFVKSLGANEVFDYGTFDPRSGSQKFDGIFDVSATMSFSQAKPLLAHDGVYVTTVPDRSSVLPILLSGIPLPGPKAKIVMSQSGNRVSSELLELAQLVASGEIQPIISSTVSLDESPQAQATAEQGHTRGKTVIRIP
ncbi:MAG TPA: NAD(P)-dependent alcohol dehydrogenase [Planktothrix sp.]|jgi:NADPH:quinone reductase-like Zn-dependent oxidoreductase